MARGAPFSAAREKKAKRENCAASRSFIAARGRRTTEDSINNRYVCICIYICIHIYRTWLRKRLVNRYFPESSAIRYSQAPSKSRPGKLARLGKSDDIAPKDNEAADGCFSTNSTFVSLKLQCSVRERTRCTRDTRESEGEEDRDTLVSSLTQRLSASNNVARDFTRPGQIRHAGFFFLRALRSSSEYLYKGRPE